MNGTTKSAGLQIDCEICLGCGNCIAACPLSNPESPMFNEDSRKLRLESGVVKKDESTICWKNSDVPEDCKKCTLLCPTGAIEVV